MTDPVTDTASKAVADAVSKAPTDLDLPTPALGQSGAAYRAARVVTEVFAPGILVVAILLTVGRHATGSVTGAAWGLLAAFFCGVLPYAFIIWGVRRGHWTDHHIKVREQRAVPLLVTLVSVVTGIVLLAVLPGAPHEVFALVIAMLAGLVATIGVTKWWKVSIHTAVAGGAATVLVLTYGAAAAAAAPLVALIGWSRVVLRDHTMAQTIVGALLGSSVAATVFTLIR